MEFQDVVRRRRMVRRYADTPVAPEAVQRLLSNATRAPSAGFTQGWAFLVLEDREDLDLFWRVTTPDSVSEGEWLRGMRTAPLIVVPLSSRAAYLDRYAQPDKGWTDRDEARWPVPYWHLDTAMASLLILLTAVDEGLGACFFGIPPSRVPRLRQAFGVPEEHTPVGAISVGHRLADTGAVGSPGTRRRRPLDEVVHRGRW